jgi:hypothetical protein
MTKHLILILSLIVVGSTAYDISLARELQRASTASYCEAENLRGMRCDACQGLPGYNFLRKYVNTISFIESVSYSIFISPAKQRVIFAFRGSHPFAQIGLELAQCAGDRYDIHNIPNAKSTSYFYTKYKNNLRGNFLNDVRSAIRDHPGYSFYFTGHSLGGAFAALGALDVSLSNILAKNRIILYTFGAPREGNRELAQAINSHVGQHYRVVHRQDPVPRLPPSGLWGAYHSGTEVFYDGDSANFKICALGEDSNCCNKYKNLLPFDDHSRYLGMSSECHAR